MDFSSLDSPLLDNLSTEELLKDLLQRRNREITTFKVVRDRMFGTLSIVENMHSSSKDSPHQIIPCKPSLPPFEDLKQKDRNDIGLIEPHKGRLSRMLDVDLHEVSKQINLIGEIKVKPAEMERQFSQRETKEGKVKWVSSMRGTDLLSKKLMQTQPELKLQEEQHSIQTDWQIPTEQSLLDVLSEPNPKGKGNDASSTHNQIYRTRATKIAGFLEVLYNEFTSEEHQRLASVLPVVGTEEQQWDAAIEVMRSGNRDTLLLSAFTNVNFVEDINNIMNLTNIDEANEIHLTVGEPDRVNEQG